MKRTLAIIGTAGRGLDRTLLTPTYFTQMYEAVCNVENQEGWKGTPVTDLVSGGAAWADHAAVKYYRVHPWIPIHLFLPKRLNDRFITHAYHSDFSTTLDKPSDYTWQQVLVTPHTDVGSFKDRNTCVANAADVFLAMTFGDGPRVKDGGTADTVRKMLARGVRGYHLDLFTGILHDNATVDP